MKADPALVRALSLDPTSVTISSHGGGSGFASILKLSTSTRPYFVKTSPATSGAALMFEGEHASLNAIHNAVPSLCPKSYAWGKLENTGGYFLATEFLELGGMRRGSNTRGKGSGLSLAQKLGKLHTTPAPVPEGFDKPMFGFPTPTCCGDTPQPNRWQESWADFFAEDRLKMILERAEKRNGVDKNLRNLVERTVETVVSRLLRNGHLGGKDGIKPVVVHGDLWSGNKGKASVTDPETGEEAAEDMVFDPSACYAHSEFELGIMNMFGGFNSAFMKEYHQVVPKTEPVEEYQDRVDLYESYHHLNHYAIFGGGYKGGAVSLLSPLVKKYGG